MKLCQERAKFGNDYDICDATLTDDRQCPNAANHAHVSERDAYQGGDSLGAGAAWQEWAAAEERSRASRGPYGHDPF